MSSTQKDLERRLEGWLDREAERIGSGESFAPSAYLLARRRRFRKRIGAAVTSVAVAAVLLPAGLWVNNAIQRADHAPDVASTVRTTTTTNAIETPKPVGPVEHVVDVTKLRQGDPPRVPWYSDGVIHDGDRQLILNPDLRAVRHLAKVDGGYVVMVDRPQGEQHIWADIYLIRAGAGTKHIAEGSFDRLAVSNDGRRIAFEDRGTNDVTLYVADEAGDVLRTKTLHGRDTIVSVFGFLGSSVVLERTPNEALSPLRLWNPETNRISDWYDAKRLAGIASDGSAVAVVTDENVENGCFGVRSVPALAKLWDSCDFDGYQAAFSPNARFVASVNYDQEQLPADLDTATSEEIDQWYDAHPAVAALYVRSVGSGTVTMKLAELAGNQLTWESDNTVLLEVENVDRQHNRATYAVVRCTLAGQCERATDFRKRDGRATPAHVLAR